MKDDNTFKCKFCRKKKSNGEYGMRHLGEDVCASCMAKGW